MKNLIKISLSLFAFMSLGSCTVYTDQGGGYGDPYLSNGAYYAPSNYYGDGGYWGNDGYYYRNDIHYYYDQGMPYYFYGNSRQKVYVERNATSNSGVRSGNYGFTSPNSTTNTNPRQNSGGFRNI